MGTTAPSRTLVNPGALNTSERGRCSHRPFSCPRHDHRLIRQAAIARRLYFGGSTSALLDAIFIMAIRLAANMRRTLGSMGGISIPSCAWRNPLPQAPHRSRAPSVESVRGNQAPMASNLLLSELDDPSSHFAGRERCALVSGLRRPRARRDRPSQSAGRLPLLSASSCRFAVGQSSAN
jgi:hypothetical protein